MRPFIVFLCFILLSNLVKAQKNSSIAWEKEDQLTWRNYKARPNRASSFQALTATGVSFAIQYEENRLTIEIINSFEPSESWTKTRESKKLLAHEQLHFNISELYARKLRKVILETNFHSRGRKLMNEISDLYEDKMKELARNQREYDRKTDHSIIESAQKRWEANIKKELATLRQFSMNTISITLTD